VTQPSLLDVMVRMFWSEGSCVRFGRRGLLAAAWLTSSPPVVDNGMTYVRCCPRSGVVA